MCIFTIYTCSAFLLLFFLKKRKGKVNYTVCFFFSFQFLWCAYRVNVEIWEHQICFFSILFCYLVSNTFTVLYQLQIKKRSWYIQIIYIKIGTKYGCLFYTELQFSAFI